MDDGSDRPPERDPDPSDVGPASVSESGGGVDPGDAPRARRLSRGRLVVIGAAIVVLVGGVAAAIVRPGARELGATFEATPTLPFTLRYPSEWHRSSGGTSVTLAPFDATNNTTASSVFQDTPGRFVALFLDPISDAASFQSLLQQPDVQVRSRTRLQVGGRPASRVDLLTSPFGAGADPVHLTLYLVELGKGQVLPFAFISSNQSFDLELFGQIVATTRFDDSAVGRLLASVTPAPPIPTGPPLPPQATPSVPPGA